MLCLCRSLRKKSKPQQGILILLNATQLGQLELRDELFDDFILTPFRHQELEARLKHLSGHKVLIVEVKS